MGRGVEDEEMGLEADWAERKEEGRGKNGGVLVQENEMVFLFITLIYI